MPPKATAVSWRRSYRKSARKSVLGMTKPTAPPSHPSPPNNEEGPSQSTSTAATANDLPDEVPTTTPQSSITAADVPVLPDEVQTTTPPQEPNPSGNHGGADKGTPTAKEEAVVEDKLCQSGSKKKVVKKTIKVIKKIVKKKMPKSEVDKPNPFEPEADNSEPYSSSVSVGEGKTGSPHAMEVTTMAEGMNDCEVKDALEVPPNLECKDINVSVGSADTPSAVLDPKKCDFRPVQVEKGTIVAEGMKDCEVKVALEEPPVVECKVANDSKPSLDTANVVLDLRKGDFHPLEIEKGTVVAEDVLGNDGMTICEDKDVLEPPIFERKDTNDSTDSLETQNVVIDSKKGIVYPTKVEKGTIVAEGNDGMKDFEVKEGLEPPVLECKDMNDNVGSSDTSNLIIDPRKGNRRSVKIVKKIVKKKVPKLAARNRGKSVELVKPSENRDTITVVSSVCGKESNSIPPESEEPCKVVSAEGEESKKQDLHVMEVEKPTNVTENVSEPSISESKDTIVVESDNMASLEIQTVGLDSAKVNIDVSSSGNVDSGKDQNPGQLGEGGDAVDANLKLNEGIVLSGEMEALERKKRRKTQVFIGGLDKEAKEADIRRIFEEVGEVVDVTLLMNRATGKNKGYAFVRYASAADATKALERFSKVEISGKQCGVSPVEGNDTIYLGNINKKWKSEDLIDLLKKAGIENIDKVTVMADPKNTEQNRGFAFVELETSKEAQIAFNKLQKKNVFGKYSKVKVAWAQPLIEPDEEEILKVKSVYAEYVPSSWNEEKVRQYFSKFGDIEGITLAKDLPSSRRNDFAFVNYVNRESALSCIEAFNHEPFNISGSKVHMRVSLAKPISKSKQTKRTTIPAKKEHREEKKVPDQFIATLKRHDPSKKANYTQSKKTNYMQSKKTNYMQRYSEGRRVDEGSSTNDELLHLLRQQRSAGQVHSGLHIGSSGVNHQYMLSGSKRPFSTVDNPRNLDSSGASRVRLESSFPTPSQSMLPHSRGPLGTPPFGYYRQLGSDHSQGSGPSGLLYGVESFPSSFQPQERGPYGYRSIYRRY